MQVATTTNVSEGIYASNASLPLNDITNIRLEANGRRIYGKATLYVSDPWSTPASANIGSIQMKSISAPSVNAANYSDNPPTVNNATNFALPHDIKSFKTIFFMTSITFFSSFLFL